MFIEFEETPNPFTLKFLPGRAVLGRGTMDFKSRDDALNAPLAKRLFDIGGVAGVFMATDFVSVTREEGKDWDGLKPLILTALMDHYATGLPAVDEAAMQAAGHGNHGGQRTDDIGSEIERQIRELLEIRVKPAVAMDGGNIEFVEFDEGVVYLRMEGACAGCPSSTMTLKQGIETMLKHYVPEVERVEPVNV